MDGFDIVAAVPVALSDDREAALASMRQELVPYASLPFYRAMLERSGFEADIAAFDEGMAAGDPERAKAGLSDPMIDSLTGIGAAEQVQGAVERYRDAGPSRPVSAESPGPTSTRRCAASPSCSSRRRPRRAPDPVAHTRHDRRVLVDAVGAGVEEARDQQTVLGRLDPGRRGRDLVGEVGVLLPLHLTRDRGVQHPLDQLPRIACEPASSSPPPTRPAFSR